jgi:hypothetical protein
MSDPDNTPRRRPPTIDLTAKEVETEQQTDSARNSAAAGAASDGSTEQGAPGERTRGNTSTRALPYILGAVVGAIAASAIVAGLWIAGLAPAREGFAVSSATVAPAPAVPPSAPDAKGIGADEISSRLDKIQEALQAPRSDAALAARVAAAEAETKALGDSLSSLTRRVDDASAASESALTQAKAAAAAAAGAKNAAQTDIQRDDFDALTNRIAALEKAVESLSAEVTQRPSGADDRAARATVAAEALRAAVERGAPYQAELAAVTALGADANAIAALAPFAGDGVPRPEALGRELAALTPALQHASGTAPNDGSLLERLQSHAQRLVRISPIDAAAAPAPSGNDPSSVIARINSDASRGDIAAALAEIGRLPDAARARADNWVKKAEAHEAAIAASRRIAADALAALAKPASQ